MKCERCGEQQSKYFYFDGNSWYCRKCIRFGRVDVNQKMQPANISSKKLSCTYTLSFDLSNEQKDIQGKIEATLKDKQKILVYAACGAGKTEITMSSIKKYLNEGKKVGYAIARRQVVLEIAERMQEAFSSLKVVKVCGEYTKEIDGDLIICTMHQLYRYHQTFDLLILDEIDAFPYAGNTVLEALAEKSCKGEMILLTATPDEEIEDQVKSEEILQYTLFKRPHGFPLPVPKVYIMHKYIQIVFMYIILSKNKDKLWIVFVPTIQIAKQLYTVFKRIMNCSYITSKTEDKDERIQNFKNHEVKVLFATTVLERGVTIEDVQVLIFEAQHTVYSKANLIQMVGRVGRKQSAPKGKAIILSSKKSEKIKDCVKVIEGMNCKGE